MTLLRRIYPYMLHQRSPFLLEWRKLTRNIASSFPKLNNRIEFHSMIYKVKPSDYDYRKPTHNKKFRLHTCSSFGTNINNNNEYDIEDELTNEEEELKSSNINQRLEDILVQLAQKEGNLEKSDWLNMEREYDMQKRNNWPMMLFGVTAYLGSEYSDECVKLASGLFEFVQNDERFQFLLEYRIFWLVYALCLSRQANKETEVLNIVNSKKGNTDILDHYTSDILIDVYCNTSEWKDALKILNTVQEYYGARHRCIEKLILTAIKNQDIDYIYKFQLFDYLHPLRRVSDTFMNAIMKEFCDISNTSEITWSIINVCTERNWYLSKEIVNDMENHLERNNWYWKKSKINSKGICYNCGHHYDPLPSMSEEEFANLRKAFFQKSVVQDNMYLNSSPEEFARFDEFLKGAGKYDIIIDFANVYLFTKGTKHRQVKMFQNILEELNSEGRYRILVVINGNLASLEKYFETQVDCFVVNEKSKDDVFTLYAALYNGQDTIIVTNDRFRAETARLDDDYLRSVFQKWQLRNQIKLRHVNGQTLLQRPQPYDVRPHFDGNRLHIPFATKSTRGMYTIYYNVFCALKPNSK